MRPYLWMAILALAIYSLGLQRGEAQQSSYPESPVRVLVGFPPGNGPDLVARTLAAKLSESLGQPFVVENRVGARGGLALEAVTRSEPNGLPSPMLWSYLAIFAESVVAACLAIGLFTRAAALIFCVYMAVIVIFFQWQFGYFWTNKGYEYALLWCLLYLAIFFRGGGRYSVDRLLGKEF